MMMTTIECIVIVVVVVSLLVDLISWYFIDKKLNKILDKIEELKNFTNDAKTVSTPGNYLMKQLDEIRRMK
jgi:uncharacterized membrane protein (DUF106 family)